MTRHFQQVTVYVDRGDVTRDLPDLQREPAVARAQINDLHARLDPHCGEYTSRVRPQRLPPSGSWHLGALEKSGKIIGHRPLILVGGVELGSMALLTHAQCTTSFV